MKKISKALRAIIQKLNDLNCHSGNELGEKLGISRNAIWKYIKILSEYGIEIESLQSMGYQLKKPLLLLDEKVIKKRLIEQETLKINKIDILASIPSTNDYIKKIIGKNNQLLVCLAEHQTAGKGRLGRVWQSPFAANVYLSLLWQIQKDISQLAGLSLVIALAIISALQKFGVQDNLTVKWPNDVLWQNKKLAGVLIELQAESHGLTKVIIGIGINTNMPEKAAKKIEQSFSSVDQILARYIDRNEFVAILLNELTAYLVRFDTYGFKDFITEWKKYDALAQQSIQIIMGNKIYDGVAQGVNEQGHLLLKDKEGKMTAYSAGDASIKKK